jgi:hypothetical protein
MITYGIPFNTILNIIIHLLKEPMLILLLVASTIYFLSGQPAMGLFPLLPSFFCRHFSIPEVELH